MDLIEWLNSFVSAPNGPGTPFATPTLVVFDATRVFIIISAFAIAALTPFVTIRTIRARHQRAGMWGLVCYALVSAGTEYDHLGDLANYRLALFAVANALALWRLWGMLRTVTRADATSSA